MVNFDYSSLLVAAIIFLVIYTFLSKRQKPVIIMDLIYYPIKSCAGIHLAKAEITDYGIKDDRIWGIFENNSVIDQLSDPRLIKLQPSFRYTEKGEKSHLILSYYKFPDFALEIKANYSQSQNFTLEGATGKYQDEGDQVAEYLKSVFGKDYRLGKLASARNMKETFDLNTQNISGQISFASIGQVLISNFDSLERLRELVPHYLRSDINMQCFRPNIIVKHAKPFTEDTWENFSIGNIPFKYLKKCDRCRSVTIHQDTLKFEPNVEPLNTLRKHHGDGTKAYFGVYAMYLKPGFIKVGDLVKVRNYH